MLKILNTVCAYLITLQDMAHSTDFPNPDGVRATNPNFDILVYMAWCDLRGRIFSGEQERWFGMAGLVISIKGKCVLYNIDIWLFI